MGDHPAAHSAALLIVWIRYKKRKAIDDGIVDLDTGKYSKQGRFKIDGIDRAPGVSQIQVSADGF